MWEDDKHYGGKKRERKQSKLTDKSIQGSQFVILSKIATRGFSE